MSHGFALVVKANEFSKKTACAIRPVYISSMLVEFLSYRVSFSASAQRSYRASLTLICNVQLSDLCVLARTIPFY